MTNFLTCTHRKCPFCPFGCHGDDDIVFILFQMQPSTVSGMQNCLRANNILGIRREPGRPAAAGGEGGRSTGRKGGKEGMFT